MTTWFITGGAGFIGSNLVRRLLLLRPDDRVVVYDIFTYAGNLHAITDLGSGRNRPMIVTADVGDTRRFHSELLTWRPKYVLHLAAESHVDRSISSPDAFIQTNIMGTYSVLKACRTFWSAGAPEGFKLVHVSTDEVYGALGAEGAFTEESRYAPNSPYSASKAAADHLVRAFQRTYGLPTVTTHCSNNFGPFQNPEKLIPHAIQCGLRKLPIPLYGSGQNVRDWLYVDDHCDALIAAAERGVEGETYGFGGSNERTNREMLEAVCRELDAAEPRANGESYSQLVTHVPDRAGHDWRYAIDSSKAQRELGWQARVPFTEGVRRTVEWYLSPEGQAALARSPL